MRVPRAFRGLTLRVVSGVIVASALVAVAFLTRRQWMPLVVGKSAEAAPAETAAPPVEELKVLKLSPQARRNLQLVSTPAKLQDYWKKIQIPGVIVDQPGRSDRGITSPVVGVVTQLHAYPGDTVTPGDRLFTLKLSSEYLQNTQKELFQAAREMNLIDEQLDRLRPLSERGVIEKSKIIDLENQLRRQAAVSEAHRQDLLTRGLNSQQIAGVADGKFVSTVDVVAPPSGELPLKTSEPQPASLDQTPGADADLAYEVQELAVILGQQVRAGQLLSTLANHRSLYIEGHAFKREAPFLENAAQNGWGVVVEFAEDDPAHWPVLEQTFRIRHLANSIDTNSRTFDFFIPLTNQFRSYERESQTFIVWRFRPGQRVRLHVPVEKLENVLVFPAEAVVREGPEAYVFRQNGDLFDRISVHVLHEDRLNVVLADHGSVKPGLYYAQNAAASLNRVLKAQAASGMRADVHVHADGTVHASH